MRELFPFMNDLPSTGSVLCLFLYWILAFCLIPLYMPLLCLGLWETSSFMSWAECIYHCINALTAIVALKEHLKDSFLTVQIDTKEITLTVLAAIMMMISYVLIAVVGVYLVGFDPFFLVDVFPISEFTVSMTPSLVVMENPIFGSICVSLIVPFAVCGLFYATGFAPLCCKNTWAGYIVVSLLLFLPVLFDIIWRGNTEIMILHYLLCLPIHLLACWSYQKTDCVWTPITALVIFNLLASVASLIII